MANPTELWFDAAAAGDETGSSWANRAALIVSGAWSNVLKGHNFSTDGLIAYVKGGETYTPTAALNDAAFTNPPVAANPLMFVACDGAGAAVPPPSPGWVSAQPAWSVSNMPVIATTTNIYTCHSGWASFRMFKFTASGRNGHIHTATQVYDWCVFENSTANTSAGCILGGFATNCVFQGFGSSFDTAINVTNAPILNCRIDGSGGTTGGNRRGITAPGTLQNIEGCTIIGCNGGGIVFTSASAAINHILSKCTILGNNTAGVLFTSVASQTAINRVDSFYIANNGATAYGIDAQSSRVYASNCRLRDNTSGPFNGFGNFSTEFDNDIIATGADANARNAAELVDYANGDYRIKITSSLWGKGYGAGDEILRNRPKASSLIVGA